MDKTFPKIVWMYWEQGFENAPYAVQCCVQSVQHYAKGYEIHLLDEKNLANYITPPRQSYSVKLPTQCISDLYRVMLLEKYGGVWIDSTVFLNADLDDFLAPYQGDFFCCFRWKNKKSMSSWFLCASNESYVAKRQREEFERLIFSESFIQENQKYFDNWKFSPNYFSFHKVFDELVQNDKEFSSLVNAMPYLDSYPLIRFAYHGWNKEMSPEQKNSLLKAPLVKLSWTQGKTPQELNAKGALFILLQKMNAEKMNAAGDFFYSASAPFPDSHVHLATEMRTTYFLNSYIDRPEYMKDVTGIVDSEGDLKLNGITAKRYHVLNFSSHSGNNCVQLLIPYDQNRVFLRYQTGKTFCQTEELVTLSKFKALEFQLKSLEKCVSDIENSFANADSCKNLKPEQKKSKSFKLKQKFHTAKRIFKTGGLKALIKAIKIRLLRK